MFHSEFSIYGNSHSVDDSYSGWWLGQTPLKNMSSSVGMIIPHRWKHQVGVPDHLSSIMDDWSHGGFLKWGYPQTSSILSNFKRILPDQPSSYWGTHDELETPMFHVPNQQQAYNWACVHHYLVGGFNPSEKY